MSHYAKSRAARLVVANVPSVILSDRATTLRRVLEALAEHGSYGSGSTWVWSTHLGTIRHLDKLADKGLVTKTPRTDQWGRESFTYTLAPEQAAQMARYTQHYEAVERAAADSERAAREAKLAKQRFAVVLVNLHDGSSRTVGEVYTGASGDVQARNQATFWSTDENRDQYKAIVVQLADA